MPLDVARVHPIEIGGKERRLIAARAGPDFDDRRPVIEGVVRDEDRAQVRLEPGDLGLQPFGLGARFGGYLGIVHRRELARFGELGLAFVQAIGKGDDGPQALVLPT
jgi:hypothetical protein